MRRLLFTTIVTFVTCAYSAGHGTDQQVSYLTPESGLNNGSINSIVQDRDGFIWIATWDGIIRYDGYTFRNYNPDVVNSKSLQSRQVHGMITDTDGRLWALTYAGVSRYNRKLDLFERIELDGEGLNYGTPYPHAELHEAGGRIYLKNITGMYLLEEGIGDENPVFRSMRCDILNQYGTYPLCVIDDQLHIILYSPPRDRSNVFRTEISGDSSDRELLLSFAYSLEGNISDILLLDNGKSVVIKDKEIGLMHRTDSTRYYETLIPDVSAREALITSNNEIWYLLNRGLGSYDFHSGERALYMHENRDFPLLLGNQINSLFEDFSGNLWIGHAGEGITLLNLKQKSFNTYRHDPDDPFSLPGNSVMCFNETNDGILVGTDYDGASHFSQDPMTGRKEFRKLVFPGHFWTPSNFISVWNIARESENIYWLATNMGLIKSTLQSGKWHHEQHFVSEEQGLRLRKLILDEYGNIWVGTYDGLFLIPHHQRDSMHWYRYMPDVNNPGSLSDVTITEILIDSKDRMWIGTRDQGINLLEDPYSTLNLTSSTAPELSFKKFSAGKGNKKLNNNEVNCLFEYYDGTIWAGTQGGGINILDPETGRIEYLTMEDGLPGNNVFGILSDEQGNLWLSTNKGICSITTFGSERNVSCYEPSDGIQGNVFMINSFFKDSRDMLYFGGRKGFTRFLPSQIQVNDVPPKIVFTDLFIFGNRMEINQKRHSKNILTKVLNETDSLVLSYKDYNLRIGVAAIHFQNPAENHVEFMLEGFDRKWNKLPPGENHINYANLDPGRYLLKVKASNSDGVWSGEIKKLHLTVTPPWYRTWYGYGLFTVIAITVIIALFRLILREQLLRHKVKLDAVQIENMKELNETKLRFFTNISHELRTPLNLVLAPIEYLYKFKDTSPTIREQLSMSLRNAKQLKRLINNIIEFRKHEAGKIQLKYQRSDITGFVRQVGRNFETLQPNMNIQLLYHIPEETVLTDFDAPKIEQVLYNILSNAFKHTPKGGTILVTLENKSEQNDAGSDDKELIVISVFNEGNTIPEEHLERIFDRFYQAGDLMEGSGIGLSVAKSLTELHNGTLQVSNIEQSGVEFRISFPRFTAVSNLTNDAGSKIMLEDNSDLTRAMSIVKGQLPERSDEEGGYKVLVIEDNAELRSFYRTLLSPSFQFHEAEDGEEGLEQVEEVGPDLVISDVVMPKKDGIEVCRQIKENLSSSHIPVILLTAKGAPDQIVEGYNAGADAYIVKPFESEVLLSQVSCMLQNRQRIREKYTASNIFMEAEIGEPRSKDDHFMKTLNGELEENLFNEDYNVVSLSKKLNISRNHLYRKVKALTGYSTVEYIRVYKLNKAAELLKTQKYSIKEVCFKTGFKDQSYFTKSFKNHFNQNPTEYIRSYSKAQ